MNNICVEVSKLIDKKDIERISNSYGIEFDKDFIDFIEINNGGIPKTNSIEVGGKEYELRCFLSFNSGEYNSIELPLKSFQEETKGKIYPIAKDSGDNYFCINKENGKVYFWDKDENLYYKLVDSFADFVSLF